MTTIADMRAELAAVFKDQLSSGWDIQPHMGTRVIGKPTVMIGSSKVSRGTTHSLRVKEVTVMVVAPKTTAGAADDQIDQLLDQVLDVVDRITGTVWSEAQRAIYAPDPQGDGTNPAYTINLTLED